MNWYPRESINRRRYYRMRYFYKRKPFSANNRWKGNVHSHFFAILMYRIPFAAFVAVFLRGWKLRWVLISLSFTRKYLCSRSQIIISVGICLFYCDIWNSQKRKRIEYSLSLSYFTGLALFKIQGQFLIGPNIAFRKGCLETLPLP